jgi:hypothetical protein
MVLFAELQRDQMMKRLRLENASPALRQFIRSIIARPQVGEFEENGSYCSGLFPLRNFQPTEKQPFSKKDLNWCEGAKGPPAQSKGVSPVPWTMKFVRP